jgi:hypothetical protein
MEGSVKGLVGVFVVGEAARVDHPAGGARLGARVLLAGVEVLLADGACGRVGVVPR